MKRRQQTQQAHRALFVLLLVVVVLLTSLAWSLSLKSTTNSNRRRRTVTFHTSPASSLDSKQDALQLQLQSAFQQVVDSTEFFVYQDNNPLSCRVPLFGDDVVIEMTIIEIDNTIALSVSSSQSLSDDDFSWICVKFHEQRHVFEKPPLNIDISTSLQPIIDLHFPQDTPGVNAAAEEGRTRKLQELFLNPKYWMKCLKENGYILLDTHIKTTTQQHELLSQLVQTTDSRQSDTIRTDRVQFLTKQQCVDCGIEQHYDFLMSIASYLNDHYDFQKQQSNNNNTPIFPATTDKPLTNPERIQLAEYQYNGYYKAHPDNSIDPTTNTRTNYREFTAILYINDDEWKSDHGGCLRLYLNSQHQQLPQMAVQNCNNYIDILPINGRLVLFDSFLIHSVQPNLHPILTRRALTLWIKRPY